MNSAWTDRTSSSGPLSQPLLLLNCTSLFSLNTSTPTAAFISAEGKEEQSGGGLRLVSGFQATWLAAGSIWSCEEGLPTLTSEETNICLKGEKRRGRESMCERAGKKILISLQTRREIKVGKTYPSKGCRVSCKMEIFPKLTDPVGCWQSWREEHMQAGRCTSPEPDVEPALTSVHTLTYSNGN